MEVPGTLLLAEAFWLLEGYFVRTLGMHRVYNSAFMNMLRDEENAKYRSYLKKTIEFDPDILKRYVNFMSNPDERTAIDQFGTGDKYFGVSTLLATLPGLPMFGHGQIEGFTEKYGMEYKQARMRETPNEELVARHQREIAPLLKKRWAFAESDNFVLYDFWNEHGTVDENVFAYSNVSGGERSLVLYNNTYGSTRGTIHVSAASMDKGSGTLRQRSLTDAMQLSADDSAVLAYRDTTNGLEYLLRAGSLKNDGFTVDLRGYQYVVLQEWREMRSTAEQPWDRLCDALNGAGVYNLDEALSKLRLRPVHDALRKLLHAETLREFIGAAGSVPGKPALESGGAPAGIAPAKKGKKSAAAAQAAVDPRLAKLLSRAETFASCVDELRGGSGAAAAVEFSGVVAGDGRTERLRGGLEATLKLPGVQSASPVWPAAASAILPGEAQGARGVETWAAIVAWSVLHHMEVEKGAGALAFDELQLRSALAEIFSGLGVMGEDAWRTAGRVRILLQHGGASGAGTLPVTGEIFWEDGDVRWLAGVNESGGQVYFNRESFDEILWWLEMSALMAAVEAGQAGTEALAETKRRFAEASRAAKDAGYSVSRYVLPAAAPSTERSVPDVTKPAKKKAAASAKKTVAARTQEATGAAKKSPAKSKKDASPAVVSEPQAKAAPRKGTGSKRGK